VRPFQVISDWMGHNLDSFHHSFDLNLDQIWLKLLFKEKQAYLIFGRGLKMNNLFMEPNWRPEGKRRRSRIWPGSAGFYA